MVRRCIATLHAQIDIGIKLNFIEFPTGKMV